MRPLKPVRLIPSYAVLIRAVHCRGIDQAAAIEELGRRGLWLTDAMKRQAGLE